MEIQKPKSHSPKIHDNTEEDLILIPPSVLDNKLRDFEYHHKAKDSISSDIALAVALIVAILSTSFRDFSFIKGSTIKGAFIVGFIAIFIKIIFSLYKIFYNNKHNRTDVIKNLLSSERSNNK